MIVVRDGRAIAVIVPNAASYRRPHRWQDFIVPIGEIERHAGMRILSPPASRTMPQTALAGGSRSLDRRAPGRLPSPAVGRFPRRVKFWQRPRRPYPTL